MSKFLRVAVTGAVVAAASFGAIARAVDTPLPTEFTSGGVVWGGGTEGGFLNDAGVCNDTAAFILEDALLQATGQDDAFDGAGLVQVDGTNYVLPGGSTAIVDLTGATLTAPTEPTGSLNVGVQWQGAGPGTIRELVSLTNPGATDLSKEIVLQTNFGSDDGTALEAASTGDISGYPTTARWFATSDDNAVDDDPPIVSVATGPGSVQSPATIQECPPEPGSLSADKNAAKADAETTTTTSGDAAATASPDVAATGTPLGTDEFNYHYSVAIPAGQTRYVMVFWSLYGTVPEAVAAGPAWNTNPTSGSEALAGISPLQLSQIVNWAFPLEIAPRFTG